MRAQEGKGSGKRKEREQAMQIVARDNRDHSYCCQYVQSPRLLTSECNSNLMLLSYSFTNCVLTY
jgi:hypothetical protein